MSPLQSLLISKINHLDNIPFLSVSLFKNKFLPYLKMRLSYYFLFSASQISLILLEYIFLSFAFKNQYLHSALSIRLLQVLLTAAIWGGLEILRTKVRSLHSQGLKHEIKPVLSKWVSGALLIAFFYLGVSLFALVFNLSGGGDKTFLNFYLFSLNIRIAVQIYLLTLHSGIYGIRRVFKPFWAMSAGEVMGFALTLLLWPVFYEFALPLAMTVSTFSSAIIAWHYIKQAYLISSYTVFEISLRRAAKIKISIEKLWRIILPAGAAIMLRLDCILLIIFLMAAPGQVSAYSGYLLVPFLNAAYGWAQLFYFDLKQVDGLYPAYYQYRLKKVLLILSCLMGAFYWIAFALCARLFAIEIQFMTHLSLLLLFISNSFLAYGHVRAFTEGRYISVILSSLLPALIIIQLFYLNWPFELKILLTAIMAYITGGILLGSKLRSAVILQDKGKFHTIESFLKRIAEAAHPYNLSLIRLVPGCKQAAKDSICRQLLKSGQGKLEIACLAESYILLFMPGHKAMVPRNVLVTACSGFATGISGQNCLKPDDAIKFFSQELSIPVIIKADGIESVFLAAFPGGEIIDNRGIVRRQTLDTPIYNKLINGSFKYLKDFSPVKCRNGFQVSALVSNLKIELIFAVPKNAPEGLKKQWHNSLLGLNIHKCLKAN